MSGRPTAEVIEAMRLVLKERMRVDDAAEKMGVHPTSVYRAIKRRDAKLTETKKEGK